MKRRYSTEFVHVQRFFNDIMLDNLQRVKVGLITWGQREETPKLVRLSQCFTLFPEGGVVWKLHYCLHGDHYKAGQFQTPDHSLRLRQS